MTLKEFIEELGISLRCQRIDRNRDMPDFEGDHWRVQLKRRIAGSRAPRTMTLTFSKGYGHGGAEPTAAEVLECLRSDAFYGEHNTFEEFCYELGYDPDSRKAEKTYHALRKSYGKLKRWLNDYYPLLMEVDDEDQ